MNKTLQSENWSKRKQAMFQHVEASASDRKRWINTNLYYHKRDVAYLNFILSKDCSVLDIGCGNGWLLSQLNARVKCGIDLSPSMVDVAKKTCPEATVIQADIEATSDLKKIRDHGPFDYIVLSDTLAFLDDIEVGLSHVRQLCGPSTRVVLSRYNQLWEPVLKFGELIGRKQRMKLTLTGSAVMMCEAFVRCRGWIC